MAQIVVIGAGIGGLAAAARLAVKGHDVTIVEQSEQLGGMARGYAHGGFTFDLGPTRLQLPAVYRDLFLKTGASLEDSVDLVEVPDGTKYHWSDGSEVTIPSVGGTAAARAMGAALGSRNDASWRELTKRAGEMWRIIRPELLERQFRSVAELEFVTATRQARKTLSPTWSLHKLAKKSFKDRRARQLVEQYALATGSDPRLAPAALITNAYVEQTFGTWWITGGIHQLVTALVARCVERGVEIRAQTRALEILIEQDAVVGVLLADGSRIDATVVVANTNPTVLRHLVRNSPADPGADSATTAAPTNSVFTILAAVHGTTPGVAHENVFLSPDPTTELDQLSRGLVATQPTIRVCVPADANMHPPNHEAWTIHVTAPRHQLAGSESNWPGLDWSEPGVSESYAQLIFDELRARGVSLRSRLLWHEVRTPADLERETGAPGGAAFGPAPTGWQDTWLKPTIQTVIPGLFLVGGSTQPGAGLDRIGIGAEILAETIGRAKRRKRRD